MDPGSHIKSLLQFQLGSDNSTVRNLPYCLSTLTSECFVPSAHVAKWTSRVNSLMHAKDPSARWAGLCLAFKTSLLSQAIMIDCAQSWVVIALSALSRNEPLPVLKAALRLFEVIFTTATDINEFQRQVTVPNIPKLTSAILSLSDNHKESDLKVFCMKTLAHLIILYPTAHRASSANITAFCLRYLSDSSSSWNNIDIMNAASELYSVLHVTGGKVGSINLWRKSVDQTLAFGWDAFLLLRTTFNHKDQQSRPSLTAGDPQMLIPLNLHKLRSSVVTLGHLLSTVIHRPVRVPIGGLVNFITALLSCSKEDKVDGFADPLIHSMEVALVPEIVAFGCELLMCLAKRFPLCLAPHLIRLSTILVVQLERKSNSRVQLNVVQSVKSLFEGPYVLDSTPLCGRIVKAVLPSIMRMVISPPSDLEVPEILSNKTKYGRKRARNFEGEEMLKTPSEIICPMPEDREVVLISVDVIGHLLRNPALSSAMTSIVGRVMVALLVTLPRRTISSLSPDPNFVPSLTKKVQALGFRIGSGTTSVMSKALPFIIEASLSDQESDTQRNLELLLHPRLAPLVRAMPHLESLSLLKAEESNEEAAALLSLAEAAQCPHPEYPQEDMAMEDIIPTPTGPVEAITPQEAPTIPAQESSKLPSQYKSGDWNLNQQAEESIPRPFVSSSTSATSNPGEVFQSHATLAPAQTKPLSSFIPPSQEEEEEEEEEMPLINMSSDSEIEEDV